jgi:hypothetical protein
MMADSRGADLRRAGRGLRQNAPECNGHNPSETLSTLTWFFSVVGTGVDPVTSRFSGARRIHETRSPRLAIAVRRGSRQNPVWLSHSGHGRCLHGEINNQRRHHGRQRTDP